MAASPKTTVSKTARSSTRSSTKTRAMPAADIDRLIPLNGGKNVYLLHPDGRSLKFSSTSPEFVQAVTAVSDLGFGLRLKDQIDREAAKDPSGHWAAMATLLNGANAFGEVI